MAHGLDIDWKHEFGIGNKKSNVESRLTSDKPGNSTHGQWPTSCMSRAAELRLADLLPPALAKAGAVSRALPHVHSSATTASGSDRLDK